MIDWWIDLDEHMDTAIPCGTQIRTIHIHSRIFVHTKWRCPTHIFFGNFVTFVLIDFEFETRLLLAQFGFALRLFLGIFVSVNDFYSNILNSKQSFCWESLVSQQALTVSLQHFHSNILNSEPKFCWWSLVSQQDFCSQLQFQCKTFIQTFRIRNKAILGTVWFRSKTFLEKFGFTSRL